MVDHVEIGGHSLPSRTELGIFSKWGTGMWGAVSWLKYKWIRIDEVLETGRYTQTTVDGQIS